MLNPADTAFEARLRAALPAAVFKDAVAGYFTEPRGRWHGQGLVVAPGTTQEVVQIVRACADARVGVVPYGGGTGLVGGQILQDGPKPVVLSLERMNQIRNVHADENTMVVDAGVVLADIQAAAAKIDRLFPLSLASEGSARIGGLLSTNAGGVNVLRYGNARAQCLGLEVVRPDGTVWNGLTRLRKDNTGYDLRDLMIGAEGTLGVITGAVLKLAPRPGSVATAMLAVPSPRAALDLLALAGLHLGDTISAFELIHRQGLEFLSEVGPVVKSPFADPPEWMTLIDIGMPGGADATSALSDLFETAMDAGLVHDGVLAQSEADRQRLWAVRELIPEANRRVGSVSSHDISLPLSVVPKFIRNAAEAVEKIGNFRINCFGHLGDGNLHYNVFPLAGRNRDDHLNQRDQIKSTLHDMAHAFGGSVSAEHGIGRLKTADLERYSDPAKLAMIRAIKIALDPAGIMNPGAILGTV